MTETKLVRADNESAQFHNGVVFSSPDHTVPKSNSTPFLFFSEPSSPKILGTIQVLRHQRGGWVGSEIGNF